MLPATLFVATVTVIVAGCGGGSGSGSGGYANAGSDTTTTTAGGASGKTAGKIKLVIADKSNIHNFHLTGPGGKAITAFDVKANKTVKSVSTSVGAVGTRVFILTLKRGTYKFVCDPHVSSMKGSFTVK